MNGLMLGASYALVGVAFTLILGIFDMLNIAIGEVFMLGAFFALALVTRGGAARRRVEGEKRALTAGSMSTW